jgi:hypothetical protein
MQRNSEKTFLKNYSMEKFKCHFKKTKIVSRVPKCHSRVITNLILRNQKTHAHDENEEKLSTQKIYVNDIQNGKIEFRG